MDAREKFELRRKKILDNAEARLMRITGRIDRLNYPKPDPPEWGRGHCCTDHGCCHLRTTHVGEGEGEASVKGSCSPPSVDANGTVVAPPVHPITPILAKPLTPTPAPTWPVQNGSVPKSDSSASVAATTGGGGVVGECWRDWAAVVVLALLVRTALGLGYGWAFADNVLAPFFGVVIPRLVYLAGRSKDDSRNGGIDSGGGAFSLLYLALVLARLRPGFASLVVTALLSLRRLFRFLAVYLFAFVMAHLAVESYMET